MKPQLETMTLMRGSNAACALADNTWRSFVPSSAVIIRQERLANPELVSRFRREIQLAGKLAHVNLIPLNPTPGSRWDASPKPVQREFVRRLRAAGVATTVRDTRGREIDGACGQLAATEAEPASAC